MQAISTAKRVCIETWGCQMNVTDSDRMFDLLRQSGFIEATSPEDADLVILNTCSIREKARHKVLTRLGELRTIKLSRPQMRLAVAGCVAQTEAKALAKKLPFVDLIIGPDQIEDLPRLLQELDESNLNQTLLAVDFSSEPYSISLDKALPRLDPALGSYSRYVNIIKGCNNFCSYCVVPYTRGREHSRAEAEIIREVDYFLEHGTKEIILLGQNVNSYGLDQEGSSQFVNLLYKVAERKGIERLKFVTSNPHDFPRELAQAFVEIPILASQLHLPIQSGSNRILLRMNRKYTREIYLEKIEWLRAARPDLAISTDLIVGFPGETTEDFQETLDIVRRVEFAFVFAFNYSPRPKTPAAKFEDQIDESIKSQRLRELLDLQKEITERRNRTEIGKTLNSLVLYKDSRADNSWYGRTFQGHLVRISSEQTILGQTVPVKITGANATALAGIIQPTLER